MKKKNQIIRLINYISPALTKISSKPSVLPSFYLISILGRCLAYPMYQTIHITYEQQPMVLLPILQVQQYGQQLVDLLVLHLCPCKHCTFLNEHAVTEFALAVCADPVLLVYLYDQKVFVLRVQYEHTCCQGVFCIITASLLYLVYTQCK